MEMPVPKEGGISNEREQRIAKLSAKAEPKAEPESGAASEQCVVCMEDILAGEEVLRLPCDHRFHKACVVDWLKSPFPASCPLCKSDPLASDRNTRGLTLGKPGNSTAEHNLAA